MWAAVGVLLLLACHGDRPPAQEGVERRDAASPAERMDFGEAFEVVGQLVLEETEDAVTVEPFVTTDDSGRFLLAEPREGQVRIYSPDGSLLANLGRSGAGPGELRTPVSARVTPGGDILVADPGLGRLTYFPEDPEVPPRMTVSPVPTVSDARDLGNGRLLIVGRSTDDEAWPLLHLWSRTDRQIERSFFPMPSPPEVRATAGSLAWVHTALSGDTILAVFALADTVYRFGMDGSPRGRVPIPLSQPVGIPRIDPTSGSRERQEALDALTRVFNVFVLGTGDLAIQTARTRGREVSWGLVIMSRDGEGLVELVDAPRLMAVDEDRFFFRDPESLLPNRWLIAVRRPGP